MTTLSEETRATVKATVPVLQERGVEIVGKFYHILFESYPITASFFNKDRVAPEGAENAGVPPQVAALAGAVVAYAQNIDDVSPIMPVVERICHKHVSRDVRGPHYALVGECLLKAIGEVLGPKVATAEVAEAWGKAFTFLADAFIATETKIREAAAEAAGGFSGYKPFTIVTVVEHAPGGAKTFTLEPVEGSAVPAHSGGQYLSFVLEDVEELGKCKLTAMISDVSSGKLVFTVFPNEERPVAHLLSLKEGDELKTSVPCGPFKLDVESVGEMKSAIVTGKAEDAGMLCAVAKDLIASGVEEVTIVVEKNERYGDVAATAAGSGVSVETVDTISPETLSQLVANGIFSASSLRNVCATLADAAEGNTDGGLAVTFIE